MIQRIQTLYLFMVVVLGVLMCLVPLVTFTSVDGEGLFEAWQLRAFGVRNVEIDRWILGRDISVGGGSVLGLATLLISLIGLVDIFLYRHRIVQARLGVFLSIVCLGYYGVVGVYVWYIVFRWGMEWYVNMGMSIPLVCFVLTLMSVRCILRDEALVRSYERLR